MTDQKDRAVTLAVFAGVLLVYSAFVTRNYYWDGIHFAHTIENAASYRELLHPNHLIYNFVGYFLYSAVDLVIPGTRALYVLQYLNCVLGALCAVVLFRILRSVLGSVRVAAALAFLFAFSATWWKYSTDADAYVASVLFLLICFYLVLPRQKPRPLAVAALHVGAMCFHQLAVFFIPVIVAGLLFQTRDLPNKKRIASVATYMATAGAATLAAYAAAFCWITGGLDPAGFLKWVTSYSPEIGFVFNAAESLKYTVRGTGQLFFGGRFGFLNEVPTALAIVVFMLMAASLVWLLQGLVRKKGESQLAAASPSQKPVIILCLLWIATYLVFLFFFIPQATFYRLFYFPALIVLIGIAINRLGPKAARLLPPVAAIVALANFLFYIYPHSRVRAGTPLALAAEMRSVWGSQTAVLYSVMTSDALLARYFNPETVWIEVKQLEAVLRHYPEYPSEATGLWLETSAIRELSRSAEGEQWLRDHAAETFHVGAPYDVTFMRVRP